MATHPARRGWSYAEFARLPDDGNRYEVIGGELYVTPSPRLDHQDIVGALVVRLRPFVDEHGLGKVYAGPVDVLFAKGDYLAPDLVFLASHHFGFRTQRGIEGPPDLVVEVLSPGTAVRDRTLKRQRYALYGVPEYWTVDVDRRRVEIYRPLDEQPAVLDTFLCWQPVQNGPVLEIDLVALFRELD